MAPILGFDTLIFRDGFDRDEVKRHLTSNDPVVLFCMGTNATIESVSMADMKVDGYKLDR